MEELRIEKSFLRNMLDLLCRNLDIKINVNLMHQVHIPNYVPNWTDSIESNFIHLIEDNKNEEEIKECDF